MFDGFTCQIRIKYERKCRYHIHSHEANNLATREIQK